MATEAQFAANRENSQFSTGPTTETGKQTSSRNALTLGLYTGSDYVRPEERGLYSEFRETFHTQLAPQGLLEETFTAEITGAAWRLRRCSIVEADLADTAGHSSQDPMLDESTEPARRSIERARSHAHSLLNRAINQLRRLQTERLVRHELSVPNPIPADAGLADFKQVTTAFDRRDRGIVRTLQTQKSIADAQLASICKDAEPAPQIARNALCPCNSGEKYKRCCGKTAPPVLGQQPRKAA
jgi:hypothetical protein